MSQHIVSWFDLEMCSKVIEDGTIGQNMYDFLLVFYSSFGRISYRFCATIDGMPKWRCWTTVTSERQWRSIRIISQMKSHWDWAEDLPLTKISCKSVHNYLHEAAHRQTEWQTNRPDRITSLISIVCAAVFTCSAFISLLCVQI